jgi:eukaryotic-like serine/threonine-protein kinase
MNDQPTLAAPGDAPAEELALLPGTVVGRYVVLSKLGAGGMGVVHAAYDPELDRKVALKLLLPSADRAGETEGHTRLLREAQALAKLQHPNVVVVHDVGTHDERVWLAMEFVEGQTLGAWLRESSRSWKEIVEVIGDAGRGIAAAHASDILHRDLKPDNIMVATDGRVRVMDFGLARSRSKQPTMQSTRHEHDALEKRVEALSLQVTRAGSLLGTPAYMAPEQFLGEEVGPPADQYSLCVTLWEALFGVRPHRGKSVFELAAAVLEGRRDPPPSEVRIPAWLRRVVDRGLSVDPEKRWPSVEALIETLQCGAIRARRRRATTVVGVATLAGAMVLGWQQLDRRSRIAACERAGTSIEDVWNAETRESVYTAIANTGVSYAADTAEKVMPWLDRQADEWAKLRTELCLDLRVHDIMDEAVYERGLWCLEDRRMELEGLIAELARPGVTSVEKAVQATAGLRSVAPCASIDLLARMPDLPLRGREEVRLLRLELSRAMALRNTGSYTQGLESVSRIVERADSLGWPPLLTEARRLQGDLLEVTGDYVNAEQVLETAFFEAAGAEAQELVARIAEQLTYTVGVGLARHEDGLRWSRHAKVALDALPDVSGTREATHLDHVGLVLWRMGRFDEARALHEQSAALLEDALGAAHPRLAGTLTHLASAQHALGKLEEAVALRRRAVEILEAAVGAEHPELAIALNGLGITLLDLGAYEEAEAVHGRTLHIFEQAFGPEHPKVAGSLVNLGNTHLMRGAPRDASALYERALPIFERALGPEHPNLAAVFTTLGMANAALGEHDLAEERHQRALSIREKVLGVDHIDVAQSLAFIADCHRSRGAHADAEALYERALAIRRPVLGTDHPDVASNLNNLGLLSMEQGDHERAWQLFEQACTIWESTSGLQHPAVASCLGNLGRIHHARGEHDEADAKYAQALGILEQVHGPASSTLVPTLLSLANLGLERGEPAQAVLVGERAIGLLDDASSPEQLGDVRFVLARALWMSDREPERVRVLTQEAREAYERAGTARSAALAELHAWSEEARATRRNRNPDPG